MTASEKTLLKRSPVVVARNDQRSSRRSFVQSAVKFLIDQLAAPLEFSTDENHRVRFHVACRVLPPLDESEVY